MIALNAWILPCLLVTLLVIKVNFLHMQGGLDFKCPIKVYKVLVGSSAHRFGLDERDVILEVYINAVCPS